MNGLYTDNILASPIRYDWSQGPQEDEDGPGWDLVRPDVSNWTALQLLEWASEVGLKLPGEPDEVSRQEILDYLGVEDRKSPMNKMDDDELKEVYLQEIFEDNQDDGLLATWREKVEESLYEQEHRWVPAMNYLYPLGELHRGLTPEGAQSILELNSVPLCVVLVAGTPGLALTGGGMDMSDDICRAYVMLGFHPPFYFTDLPRMAGFPNGPKDLDIIAKCVETTEILQSWCVRRLEHLASFARQEGGASE